MPERLPVILVVEHVRSLHNLGALFRTADAVHIEEVVLSPLCATPPRTEISKTALGAEHTVPWRQVSHLSAELLELKKRGYSLVALEQSDISTELHTTELSFPLALVIGNEREGVSKETLGICNQHIELPMRGTSAHSLNVATATGITLYEMGRRLWYD